MCNRFSPHPPDSKSLRVLGSSQGLLGAPMGVAHTARDRYFSIKRGARPADFLELENQTQDERSYLYSFCLHLTNILEHSHSKNGLRFPTLRSHLKYSSLLGC